MYSDKIEIQRLPDIEMYGGDTLPWEFTLVNENGNNLSSDIASNCSATLTFMSIKVSMGGSIDSNSCSPVLIKTGVLECAMNGENRMIFTFDELDTKYLRGKYLYQIEVRHREDLRLSQGYIYIKQNINR